MFTNIIRNNISDNLEGFFGDIKDINGCPYIEQQYKEEFRSIFQNLNLFIRECFCSDYELTSEELCGVLVYHWTSLNLREVTDPRTFHKVASLILIDVKQLLLEEETNDEQ